MKKIQSIGYQVEIGSINTSSFSDLLNSKYSKSKIVIIVDENSHDNCLEYFITTFEQLKDAEVMMLPAGEENKVLEVCFQVWEAMTDYEVSRNDLVINLGGGVVTDMGGFIASIYKRGIDFINIPTTLLSMVDASVGGKTGIDLGSYKNQLGTFTQPKAVYIDLIFANTLDDSQLMSGFAEMLKHGLVLDKIYWEDLIQIDSNESLLNDELIYRSVALKNEIVLRDTNEKSDRKLLNFGHTIGHAIEGYSLMTNPISHGHAVGIGMLAESFISYKNGWLEEAEWLQISSFLSKLYPMIPLQVENFDAIIELMKNDKKNQEGEIRSCLLKGIGKGVYDQTLSIAQIYEALAYLIS